MARPIKGGVDYFPLDVTLDDKVELIEAEFGLKGFAVVVKLWQRIYSLGYYCEWNDEVALLFGRYTGLGGSAVSEIASASIKRGIFDAGLFEKYGILTSAGIQNRYFEIVARRQSVSVDRRYLLIDVTKMQNIVYINPINVCRNPENVDDNSQSKLKETKGKETKALSARAALGERFERFWDAYPKKMERGTAESAFLRISPDEDLLREMLRSIDKAKRSAQWTDKGGRFIPYPAKWLKCEGWKNVVNESEGKASYNGYEQRDYSSEELEAAAGTQALLDEARVKD